VDLENKLANMQEHLTTRNYKPGRSICFVVSEPKPREIFAAEFNDRIVNHLIINEIQPLWEKYIFIENSFACRKGKGHHVATDKMSKLVKTFKYFGQFDINNFFASINKEILFEMVVKNLGEFKRPDWWKEELRWLIKVIIFNDPTINFRYKGDPKLKDYLPKEKSLFAQKPNTGLPIGNLTSQFFANVYLNELDHFASGELKIQGYGRYVDDFLLFSDSREEIKKFRNDIEIFLREKLQLKLHPRKQQIQPCRHGIPFVGYFIKPWGVTARRNVVKNLKNKLYRLNQQTEPPVDKALASLNSYYGHLGKAKTFRLRKHLYEKHLSEDFKKRLKPANKEFTHLVELIK